TRAVSILPCPATPDLYTLSLHDALPISSSAIRDSRCILYHSLYRLILALSASPRGVCRSRSNCEISASFSIRIFTISKCPSSARSEEHTSELQSRENIVCRLLLEKKKRL